MRNTILALATAGALSLSLAGCVAPTPVHKDIPALPESPTATPTTEADKVFTLRILGTGNASNISYNTDTGSQQVQDVPLPWETTVPITQAFAISSLVASIGPDGGDVTCEIYGPDGTKLSSNTSTGNYATVTCTGTVKP